MSSYELALQLLFGVFGFVFLFLFSLKILRESSLGAVVFLANSWTFLGLYIIPILLGFGWIPLAGNVYIKSNLSFGLAASIHCLLLAFGMFLGGLTKVGGLPNAVSEKINYFLNDRVERIFLKFCLLVGFLSYLAFFSLVGVDTALTNAAAARGGDFDGFDSGTSYMFLKTLGACSLLGGAALLYFLEKRTTIFVLVYFSVVAMSYVNSISRTLLLATLISPFLVYYISINRKRKSIGSWFFLVLKLCVLGEISLLVVQYGKIFGHFLTSQFDASANAYNLLDEGRTDDQLNLFLSNYTFMWYSVDAGVTKFLFEGTYVTSEPLLAFLFGWIPVGLLNAAGLGEFYYGNLPDSARLACVNGSSFIDGGCTVPPLMPGYSAYLFPFVGAFVFGLVSGYMTNVLSALWKIYEDSKRQRIWVPYFLYGLFLNCLTFIPSTIGYSVFSLLYVVVGVAFVSLFIRDRRRLKFFAK